MLEMGVLEPWMSGVEEPSCMVGEEEADEELDEAEQLEEAEQSEEPADEKDELQLVDCDRATTLVTGGVAEDELTAALVGCSVRFGSGLWAGEKATAFELKQDDEDEDEEEEEEDNEEDEDEGLEESGHALGAIDELQVVTDGETIVDGLACFSWLSATCLLALLVGLIIRHEDKELSFSRLLADKLAPNGLLVAPLLLSPPVESVQVLLLLAFVPRLLEEMRLPEGVALTRAFGD